MTTIHAPLNTKASAMLCPQCSSPSIQPQDTGGYNVLCGICGWRGVASELVSMPFYHEFGSDEGIATALMNDMRNVIAVHAGKPLGSFLLKWGFLKEPFDGADLGRYLGAIAKAILTAIIEENKKIAEEASRGK